MDDGGWDWGGIHGTAYSPASPGLDINRKGELLSPLRRLLHQLFLPSIFEFFGLVESLLIIVVGRGEVLDRYTTYGTIVLRMPDYKCLRFRKLCTILLSRNTLKCLSSADVHVSVLLSVASVVVFAGALEVPVSLRFQLPFTKLLMDSPFFLIHQILVSLYLSLSRSRCVPNSDEMAAKGRKRSAVRARGAKPKPKATIGKRKLENQKKRGKASSPPNSPSTLSSSPIKRLEDLNPEGDPANGTPTSGFSTPKAPKYQIPKIKTCPPAPKRQRVDAHDDRSLTRRQITFFAPPELEVFFLFAHGSISG